MIGLLKKQKTIYGFGWFINDIPLHNDDIEKYVNYKNGELIHKYENKKVKYYMEDFSHSFYGKMEVVRLSEN